MKALQTFADFGTGLSNPLGTILRAVLVLNLVCVLAALYLKDAWSYSITQFHGQDILIPWATISLVALMIVHGKTQITWLLRTMPITLGTVILLCTIHGFAALEGNIESIRATWGLNPGTPVSWLTHSFLHADRGHLIENAFLVFLPSGALVELYLGKTKLVAIILATAVAAAVMSAIAVPEYWETESNPIGFSAVAQATFMIGVYIGGRVTTTYLGTILSYVPMFRETRDWPWNTFGAIVGIAAAGMWLTSAIAVEWNNPDVAPRVAHSFGMLIGASIAMLIAPNVDRNEEPHLSRPLIGLAITVTIIAALTASLPPT